jgi:hypothetical protein
MPRLSFTLRDVFWLTLVVGMGGKRKANGGDYPTEPTPSKSLRASFRR